MNKIRACDVNMTRSFPSGYWTCATIVDGVRVSRKYIGYSKRESLRDFLQHVNQKQRVAAWQKWLKAHNTNAMVWPFNSWELHRKGEK